MHAFYIILIFFRFVFTTPLNIPPLPPLLKPCSVMTRCIIAQSRVTDAWNDISTSKHVPSMSFAPKRRGLFHQHPSVVWDPQFFTLLTPKCAPGHSALHFFDISTSKEIWSWGVLYILTSTSARWLRTRRFSEPTWRPSGAPIHWKNTVLRDFSTFWRTCIFFLLTFCSLTLPTSAFPCVHSVGNLTSKLP